jgi:uncharacterized protein (DUF433 family)
MTVKWVKVDPLVMNGEPFCYNTRLSVRNILEMRAAGLTPARMVVEHPELRTMTIAEAFRYAAEHRDRYADCFAADGSLPGPAFTDDEAARFPDFLRAMTGIVVASAAQAGQPAAGAAAEAAAGS